MDRVIIIGAGFAGLAAANKLREHHIPSLILEARQRPGGRVLTDYSMGIPISLGPQWIHGLENNPIKKIADDLSLDYHLTNFTDALFLGNDHKTITTDVVKHFFEAFDTTLASANTYAQQQTQDISLASALKAINATSNQDQHTHIWKDLYHSANCFLSLYTGASTKHLSALYWDQEKILPGGNHFLLDGFTPLINLLTQSCHISYNTTVLKISRKSSHFTVTTTQGEFTAEKIIITAPLGVLKKGLITFEPALPDIKLSSIEKLRMGLLNAIVLKFPTVFWPNDSYGIFLSNSQFHFRSYMNINYFQKQPILTGRIAGDEAIALETLEDNVWVDTAMSELSNVFGQTIPQPQRFLTTRWLQDPFSSGSYSYIPVGATGEDHDVLAESIDDQLFFAGEATHREHPATVHGAYLSGIREAEKVLETIN